MHKCECTFIIRIISFLQKSCFHEKISLYKIMSPRGIFWTILTYFTILEFLECLLFASLNDFSLKITEFTWYSQMQAYFFYELFSTNIFYILMPTGNFFGLYWLALPFWNAEYVYFMHISMFFHYGSPN